MVIQDSRHCLLKSLTWELYILKSFRRVPNQGDSQCWEPQLLQGKNFADSLQPRPSRRALDLPRGLPTGVQQPPLAQPPIAPPELPPADAKLSLGSAWEVGMGWQVPCCGSPRWGCYGGSWPTCKDAAWGLEVGLGMTVVAPRGAY